MLIDKEVLLRDLKVLEPMNNKDIPQWVLDVINGQQEVSQGWIPCSERLPKEREHYLVTVKWEGGTYVDTDDYFVYGWDDYKDAVLAWQELPSPWKGEEE